MIDAHHTALSGAKYLASLVDKQGRFKYRFDPEKKLDSRGYNVLRHCGTVWAMMDTFEEAQQETEILDASRRAGVYLLNKFLVFDGDLQSPCIMEKNAIKLGGNALAIIALLSVNKFTEDEFLREFIVRLGDYILSHQQPDGDFIHKKFFLSQKISQFRSMYYTGEALLALLMLYESTGEERFLESVVTCENKLCEQDYGVAEQSHWMLYALEVLSRYQKEKAYYQHAKKIARHIVQVPNYRERGMSTPTACRSEGLLAFLRTPAPTNNQTDEGLNRSCCETVRKNLELQLAFRRRDGSFVRGGGDLRDTEVRIDYIQHNISSFLHYSRISQ